MARVITPESQQPPTQSFKSFRLRRIGLETVRVVVLYTMVLLLCLFILMPIGWMLTAALKPDTAPVFTFPPEWFPTEFWHWDTFRQALLNPDRPFLRYALNSAFISGMAIIGSVMSCSMIAFAFARLRFRGRDKLFGLLLATMLLPGPVLIIPQFLIFYRIGWYGTYLPLIVPWFTGNAFFVFLLRQYMRTIPKELDEAARVDGAGYWQIYWRIVMPLTAPALTVVAVFAFLGTWNDFFGPLLYLTEQDDFTVALALATFVRRVGTQWNEMMAANLMAIIPVLVVYFLAQNKLIGGISSVGLKG
jgi:ABC-type glycerol-3-phosphate transport system permease component